MRLEPIKNHIAAEIKKADTRKQSSGQKKSSSLSKTDSLDFSAKAQRLNDAKATIETTKAHIASQSDIRPDKIEEVRQKINNGYYNTPEFIDKLAEKLMKEFGIS